MRQQFNEDRAELEAHFSDRVNAYIELGETPEQAKISALEKFGETETVMRTLHRQKALRPMAVRSFAIAVGYLLVIYLCKIAHVGGLAWGNTLFSFVYALYVASAFKKQKCR